MTDADGAQHHLQATRGKYGWSNADRFVDIPFTTARGVPIRFTVRN